MSQTELIFYSHRMDQKGWVANHDGNLSLKLEPNRFLITPTARSKISLSEADLIEVELNGKVLSGTAKPFSEWRIHQRIYQSRPDIQAVVHAHPPSATAVGLANQEMVTSAIPEAVISLGPGIPLVGLSLPNSEEFFREFAPLVAYFNAVLVGGNGVFTWGKNLEQAFLRMELIEHLANISLKSLPLGGPRLLNAGQISELLKKREQAGLGLPNDPSRPHWYVS